MFKKLSIYHIICFMFAIITKIGIRKFKCNYNVLASEQEKFYYLNDTFKISVPFNELYKNLIVRVDNTHDELVDFYEEAESSHFFVIVYNNYIVSSEFCILLDSLLKIYDINMNYKIYLQLEDLMNTMTLTLQYERFNVFFKQFINYFNSNNNPKEEKQYINDISKKKIYVSRKINVMNLEIMLRQQYKNSFIIIDNYCRVTKNYEIAYKLLQCTFLNIPYFSNAIILCLQNKNDILDLTLCYEKMQDFCERNRMNSIMVYYSKLIKNDCAYKIELGTIFDGKNFQNITQKLIIIANKCSIAPDNYAMYTHSIDNITEFSVKYKNGTSFSQSHTLMQELKEKNYDGFSYVISNIYYALEFSLLRKIKIKKNKFFFDYVLFCKDSNNHEPMKILTVFRYIYKKENIYYRLCSKAQTTEIASFIDHILYLINFNPYLSDLPLIKLKSIDTAAIFMKNVEHIIEINSNPHDIIKNLLFIIKENNFLDDSVSFLDCLSYEIYPEFIIKLYDFNPFDFKKIYKRSTYKWHKLYLKEEKLKELLLSNLVLFLKYKGNVSDLNFFLKLKEVNQKYIQDTNDINKNYENFILNHLQCYEEDINSSIKEQIKYTSDILHRILLNEYDPIKHFICITSLLHRNRFCKQIICIYILINLTKLNINSYNIRKMFKIKYYIKFHFNFDYHENAYILDKKDERSVYTCLNSILKHRYKSIEILYEKLITYCKEIKYDLSIIIKCETILQNFFNELADNYKKRIENMDLLYKIHFYFSDEIIYEHSKDIIECFNSKLQAII